MSGRPHSATSHSAAHGIAKHDRVIATHGRVITKDDRVIATHDRVTTIYGTTG